MIRALLAAGKKLNRASFLVVPLIFCCLFFFRLVEWWQEEPVPMTKKKTARAVTLGAVLLVLMIIAGAVPMKTLPGEEPEISAHREENDIPSGKAVIYWDEPAP